MRQRLTFWKLYNQRAKSLILFDSPKSDSKYRTIHNKPAISFLASIKPFHPSLRYKLRVVQQKKEDTRKYPRFFIMDMTLLS